MNFSSRTYDKELLDGDNIPFAAIAQNMKELNTINTYLGGHAITINGFKQLLRDKKSIEVCEIGCGGGDNLVAIAAWCKKHNVSVQITGVDWNADCIEVAGNTLKAFNPRLIVADYKTAQFENGKPDIIFSSLFCHHFVEKELVYMLQWMKNYSNDGFFINDLHRHPLAYYSIKYLTAAFSKSNLVKNDAPLSVRRGFISREWKDLFQRAGIDSYSLQWKWAFRWLICSINQ